MRQMLMRLIRRRPRQEAGQGDDVVSRARRRLEDDKVRRRQVEDDMRVLLRRNGNG